MCKTKRSEQFRAHLNLYCGDECRAVNCREVAEVAEVSDEASYQGFDHLHIAQAPSSVQRIISSRF